MTAYDVFRYDLRRLRRSWIPAVALFVYTLSVAFPVWARSGGNHDTIGDMLFVLTPSALFLLPLFALALSVLAIAGERDDETARLQLGLPNSRRAFVLGKLASRLVVVSVVVLVPAVGLSAVFVWAYGTVWALTVGVYWLLTLVLAVTYTCLGIGVSAIVRSKGAAVAGGLVVYFLPVFGWSPISFVSLPKIVETRLRGTLPLPSGWSLFVEALSPITAYLRAIELAATRAMPIPPAPDTATLLQPPVMLVILLAWCCCAVAVGIRRFERAAIQ